MGLFYYFVDRLLFHFALPADCVRGKDNADLFADWFILLVAIISKY